ncbi:unnamed protein product [Calicophoron daubneyi]|uniref:Uncharacterized protein n=1 Tax=Calicophoron daubneyi TaxID=300641 RepID=A0AAV2TCN9_CALDB
MKKENDKHPYVTVTKEFLTEHFLKPFTYLAYGLEKEEEKEDEYSIPHGILIDPLPEKPTEIDPGPRVLLRTRLPEHVEEIFYSVDVTRAIQIKATVYDEKGRNVNLTHLDESGKLKTRKALQPDRVFTRQMNLTHFKPKMSPFVPDLVILLVQSIEECCQSSRDLWRIVHQPLGDFHSRGARTLEKLVRVFREEERMKEIIEGISLETKIVTLRLFLNEIGPKLLVFRRSHIKQIAEKPLLDLFLNPNPHFKTVMKQVVLSSTCVQVDTLAFVMLHLMRARQIAENPVKARDELSSIYGKMLIEFSERPHLHVSEFRGEQTVEAALMEMMFEVCDQNFWTRMTVLRVREYLATSRPSAQMPDLIERCGSRHKIKISRRLSSLFLLDTSSSSEEYDKPKKSIRKDKTRRSTQKSLTEVIRIQRKTRTQTTETCTEGKALGRDCGILPNIVALTDITPTDIPKPAPRHEPKSFWEIEFNPNRRTSEIIRDISRYRSSTFYLCNTDTRDMRS